MGLGFYHVAFDARAEITSTLVGDGKALIEAMVIGKHVVYHLENDQIKEGRVYF